MAYGKSPNISCNTIMFSLQQCWENVIAAEMYKLIWTDFFVTVFVIIAVETPRR